MGYTNYLKNMLHPLGIYNLQNGYGAAELEALGKALDSADEKIGDMLIDVALNGEHLKKAEELFPIVNFKENDDERISAVKVLLNVNDSYNDKKSLEKQFEACGVAADIIETDEKFAVELHFENIRGELSDREEKVCRAIMPAHLILRFVCSGVTWDRIESLYPTWNDFDAAGLTVSEMMKIE